MSRLPDVLRAVRDIMIAEDPATVVLCGERYLKQEGNANRVLFIIGDGTWDGAPKIGAKLVGRVGDVCTAFIWGRETKDDFDRYEAANVLRARLINALHRVAPGRITPGAVSRPVASNVLTYGEEYRLVFAYREDIAVIKSIAASPAPDGVTSPPDPLKPTGDTGLSLTVDITTTPPEGS